MGFYQEKIYPYLCAQSGKTFEKQRAEIIGAATGRVLELGVGTGLNFKYYGEQTTKVFGIDFSASMLARAKRSYKKLRKNSGKAPDVLFLKGNISALEFPNSFFDSVVAFLVFCSVPDAAVAAKEVFRVLKPEGKLLFFEHVHSCEQNLGRLQNRINPFWRRIVGGCDLTRDTKLLLEQTGFSFLKIDEYIHADSLKLTSPKIQGVAIKPVIY